MAWLDDIHEMAKASRDTKKPPHEPEKNVGLKPGEKVEIKSDGTKDVEVSVGLKTTSPEGEPIKVARELVDPDAESLDRVKNKKESEAGEERAEREKLKVRVELQPDKEKEIPIPDKKKATVTISHEAGLQDEKGRPLDTELEGAKTNIKFRSITPEEDKLDLKRTKEKKQIKVVTSEAEEEETEEQQRVKAVRPLIIGTGAEEKKEKIIVKAKAKQKIRDEVEGEISEQERVVQKEASSEKQKKRVDQLDDRLAKLEDEKAGDEAKSANKDRVKQTVKANRGVEEADDVRATRKTQNTVGIPADDGNVAVKPRSLPQAIPAYDSSVNNPVQPRLFPKAQKYPQMANQPYDVDPYQNQYAQSQPQGPQGFQGSSGRRAKAAAQIRQFSENSDYQEQWPPSAPDLKAIPTHIKPLTKTEPEQNSDTKDSKDLKAATDLEKPPAAAVKAAPTSTDQQASSITGSKADQKDVKTPENGGKVGDHPAKALDEPEKLKKPIGLDSGKPDAGSDEAVISSEAKLTDPASLAVRSELQGSNLLDIRELYHYKALRTSA